MGGLDPLTQDSPPFGDVTVIDPVAGDSKEIIARVRDCWISRYSLPESDSHSLSLIREDMIQLFKERLFAVLDVIVWTTVPAFSSSILT